MSKTKEAPKAEDMEQSEEDANRVSIHDVWSFLVVHPSRIGNRSFKESTILGTLGQVRAADVLEYGTRQHGGADDAQIDGFRYAVAGNRFGGVAAVGKRRWF